MPILSNLADTDLTSVDTKYPVIAIGAYSFKITECTEVPAKKDPESKQLKVVCELESPAKDKQGKDIPAGYKLTTHIGVTPKGDRTVDMILKDICSLIDAAFGEPYRKALGSLGNFDTDQLVGQSVVAKTKIEPEGEYPEKASIARFVPKSTEAAPAAA